MIRRIVFSISILFILSNESIAGDAFNISNNDRLQLKKSFKFLSQKKPEKARLEAIKASDEDIAKLILWLQYQKKYDGNNYEEITNFVNENPDWPRLRLLRNNAENSLSKNYSAKDILKYFADKKPITGRAMRFLAEAKIFLKDGSDDASKLLRQGWIQGDFSRDEERSFLKNHGKRLRVQDHVKRMNRLLWERKISAAKRLIRRIDGTNKNLFLARIGLMQNKRGIDHSINRVKKSLRNDPGFLYERTRWHFKRKNYKRAYDLLNNAKTTMPHQKKWWKIKNRLIREFLEDKKYSDSYKIARNHGNIAGSSDYAEGEWLAGWISLNFLKDPTSAYEHFYKLYNNVSFPVSKSRGAYWAGRAAQANNNTTIANKWYSLAAKHPTTFYGQIAYTKISKGKNMRLPKFPKPSYTDKVRYKRNELIKMAYLLTTVKKYRMAEKFIIAAIRNADSSEDMAAISQFGKQIGRAELSVTAAKHALRKGTILSETGWPTIYKIPSSEAEKSLILGIIRQESSFNIQARSPAKASGLMQLIPSTAKRVSRRMRLRYNRKKLLNNPQYNIKLGSHYIGSLIKRFDGSYLLAIASYNAGPSNVRKWIRKFGDPRKLVSHEDVLSWIESVPFAETRNYLQRVLENTQTYRHITTGAALNINADLTRTTTKISSN